MRSILRELITEHHLVIPSWDFNIGEGSDILETLHYYVIGDPFTVLSIFVPTRFLYLYYDGMILLRLYLAGVAFSCLCFQTGRGNKYAVLAGAMTYVFCFWALYNSARHPYFLNPMIYFPMLIMGMEKILKKERPYLWIISVFLSAISNFYFFYILTLTTAIYALIKLAFHCRRNIKDAFRILLFMGASAILGVLMASVILLPICHTFLSDARMSSGIAYHLLYPLSYYSKLPALFVTSGAPYWICMGFSAPTLLAVFLLFYKKQENGLLKILFCTGIIIMFVPFLGQVFNGFSYMSNRWSWAFALISAYILTVMWEPLMELEPKQKMFLFSCMIAYFIVCMLLEYSRTVKAFSSISFAFIFLILLLQSGDTINNAKTKQILALLIVLISISGNSFWLNAAAGDNYASESKERKKISQELTANETTAINAVADSDTDGAFWRYSGRSLNNNAGMLAGMSSTQYYWSLSNPYVSEFRHTLELLESSAFNYKGYDDRTALLSLASVLYFVIPANDSLPVPYGFTYVDTVNVKKTLTNDTLTALKSELNLEQLSDDQIKIIENATQSNYAVYKNNYALPIAYTYDSYIPAAVWETLNATEKQEALLQGIYLNEYDGPMKAETPQLSNKEIDYSITCNGSGISLQENAFVVTSAKSTATLKFEGLSNSETYFEIEGLNFKGVPTYDLYFKEDDVDPLNLYNQTNWDILSFANKESIRKSNLFWTDPTGADLTIKASSGASKTLNYYTDDYSYYNDRHDFSVNLNYAEDAVTSITITFSAVGIYTFDSISVMCLPMDDYSARISERKSSTLENLNFETNRVNGTISLDSSQFLCLAIPYSSGWSAWVDGEKTPLYRANIMYMALELGPGEHTIELQYQTPFIKAGIGLSILAVLILALYICWQEYHMRQDITDKVVA